MHFGEEVLKDGEEIWAEEFYHRMTNEATSAQYLPTIARRVRPGLREILAATADHVISIHISEKLSGTLSSAYLAAEMVKDTIDVTVIDSRVVSMGLGLMVIGAARAALAGVGRDGVKAEIATDPGRTRSLFYGGNPGQPQPDRSDR